MNSEYQVTPDDTILSASGEATIKATQEKQSVSFTFNGIGLIAEPAGSEHEFKHQVSILIIEYNDAAMAKAKEDPNFIDDLLHKLDNVLQENNLEKIIDWLKNYTHVADTLKPEQGKFSEVVTKFEEAGYSAIPEGIDTEPSSAKEAAEIVIGKVLEDLKRDCAPSYFWVVKDSNRFYALNSVPTKNAEPSP